MNWINVKDNLPEHHQRVLVYTRRDAYAVCIFVKTDEMNKKLKLLDLQEDENQSPHFFCSQEVSGNTFEGVTHWMALENLIP